MSAIEGLAFDEARHVYTYKGQVVPSVTQILAPMSSLDAVPSVTLAAAAAFGTAAHLACELSDLGELEEELLDPELEPVLSAWRLFSLEHHVQWHGIEERVFHPTLRYAGTLDRYGLVDGETAVVDIKTSTALYPSMGLQLAAYAQAKMVNGAKRYVVQLKRDGSYVLQAYTDPSDWPTFASLVTLRNWCVKHRITPNFKEQ
jgi:hypothetical protein